MHHEHGQVEVVGDRCATGYFRMPASRPLAAPVVAGSVEPEVQLPAILAARRQDGVRGRWSCLRSRARSTCRTAVGLGAAAPARGWTTGRWIDDHTFSPETRIAGRSGGTTRSARASTSDGTTWRNRSGSRTFRLEVDPDVSSQPRPGPRGARPRQMVSPHYCQAPFAVRAKRRGRRTRARDDRRRRRSGWKAGQRAHRGDHRQRRRARPSEFDRLRPGVDRSICDDQVSRG
jgi:hypothetical protein